MSSKESYLLESEEKDEEYNTLVQKSFSGARFVYQEEQHDLKITFPNGPVNLFLQPQIDLSFKGKYDWNFKLSNNTNIVCGPVPARGQSNIEYLMKKADIGIRSEFIDIQGPGHELPFFPVKTRFGLKEPTSLFVQLDAAERMIKFSWSDGDSLESKSFSLQDEKWNRPFHLAICGHSNTVIHLELGGAELIKPAKRT